MHVEALRELVGGKKEGGKKLEIPFTTSAKQVLEDSIECAKEQGSSSVGTSHLLRAVLRQADGSR